MTANLIKGVLIKNNSNGLIEKREFLVNISKNQRDSAQRSSTQHVNKMDKFENNECWAASLFVIVKRFVSVYFSHTH